MQHADILIIGGGLTGLSLNYFLKDENLDIVIVEARDRLGGRIHTVGNGHEAPVEMGATWFGPAHTKLKSLLDELNIETFKQKLGEKAIYEPSSMSPHQLVQLPPNQESSFRVKGGTISLIRELSKFMNDDHLYLSCPVQKIEKKKERLIVTADLEIFDVEMVVSTLPPKLLSDSIQLKPLPSEELAETMANTHTWMGESIKIGLTFSEPFWRADDLSGTIFSNVGPIPELYDHSNFEEHKFALKGFLNGSYFSVSKEERKQMVLAQLRKYYGDKTDQFIHYHEMVWANERFTYAPYDRHVLPHQNNGHAMYQKPLWEGSFFIAGAETSETSPGYMDGAVHSAQSVADQIKKSFNHLQKK
ncbi:flavin monoamine oxidase family protein [Gracilimonas tropica]|uniref:flavin monoamine oxidase family protein n=1 Tax=Gracilimonas tropica TaxID=454600 RepID=UPI00036AC2D0|nr:FAD-dependent oxidoreductase [Gracilimonas tropica]